MLLQRVEGMGPCSPAVPGHALCAAAGAVPTPVSPSEPQQSSAVGVSPKGGSVPWVFLLEGASGIHTSSWSVSTLPQEGGLCQEVCPLYG